MIALDVSPSMQLADAGPNRQQRRAQRASEVLMSVLSRIALDQVRISVVAFYNGAKPVVVDTYDLEVVRNIIQDLPLDYAFDLGKTKLLDGVREAANLARPWQPGSTTLMIVSDGDTVPDTGLPELPRSIAQTVVIGVGDAAAGTYIDGHQSRQDAATLRQLSAAPAGRVPRRQRTPPGVAATRGAGPAHAVAGRGEEGPAGSGAGGGGRGGRRPGFVAHSLGGRQPVARSRRNSSPRPAAPPRFGGAG